MRKRDERAGPTLLHKLEAAATAVLFLLFRAVGVDAASAIAGGFMRRAGPLIRPVSKRAEDNLRLVFPDWSAAERARVVSGAWENLGRTAAEFAHLNEFRPGGPRVAIDGYENVRPFVEGDRAAILVSGHFANWEVIPASLQQLGLDHAFVYRTANNPIVDARIVSERSKIMSPHQIPKGKRGGRSIIDALKGGKSLAMLVDQKLNDGIEAPFMGRPAMTAPAAARLALKFGAPILPVSIERLRGAFFRITFREPIAFSPSNDLAQDVLRLTALVNEALERDIRARPEQWLWFHRRWTKPALPAAHEHDFNRGDPRNAM